MSLRSLLVALLIPHLGGSLSAFADGMPIVGGRFAGGPTTILDLSSRQAEKLRKEETLGSLKEIVLSQAQRIALQKSAGAAPSTLLVYNTRKSENDCCCDARNRGLWFSDFQIEVPHKYLVPEGVTPMDHGNGGPLGIEVLGALLAMVAGLIVTRRVVPRSRR